MMQLPEEFTRYTHEMMGDRLYSRWLEGMRSAAPTSIRLHPRKSSGKEVLPALHPQRVPWCEAGHYLSMRPNFTFDPLMHAGAYYVQEASSMFVDEMLRQHVPQPVVMLDLCAAPGGKSTSARSVLPAGSLLFANEPHPLRAQILSENIQKYGHRDTIVTQNYPADYARSGILFDVILTDVPCSGEGMFRKDEDAIAEWSVQNVDNCSRLQRDIVGHAWKCLRPGGLLIYSTCTLNTREDEQNIRWAIEELGAEPLAVETNNDWGITGSLLPGFDAPVYRFIPGVARGEGLFMAALRKPLSDDRRTADPLSTPKRSKKHEKATAAGPLPPLLKKWLRDADSYVMHETDGQYTAIPQRWATLLTTAHSRLKVIHAGVPLSTLKGKDHVPRHGLALSEALSPTAFPTVTLDYPSAINYLRKEAITLPDDTPTGHVVVAYHGLPLGFVKNIGHRCNNLYPPEWKIRSTHIPQDNNEILKEI